MKFSNYIYGTIGKIYYYIHQSITFYCLIIFLLYISLVEIFLAIKYIGSVCGVGISEIYKNSNAFTGKIFLYKWPNDKWNNG